MKKFFAIVLASMSISGMAFAGTWYGPTLISECGPNEAIMGMSCDGACCENIWIECEPATTGWSYWTPVQYDNGTVWCQPGYAAKALACHGGCCSGISLECTQTNGSTADDGCYWKGPVGTGGTECDNADEFVHGMYITGNFGSQKLIRCCHF